MSTIKAANNGPDPLTVAREHLKEAIDRSKAGLTYDTHERLRFARDAIRNDYDELAGRINELESSDDVTSPPARKEMREIMQLIDAAQEGL